MGSASINTAAANPGQLLPYTPSKDHESTGDRVEVAVRQVDRRKDDLIPNPDRMEHGDGCDRRLDERHHDPEDETRIAASIDGRRLIEFLGNRLDVVDEHDHPNRVDQEEQDVALSRVVQIEVEDELELRNQRRRQEQGYHVEREQRARPRMWPRAIGNATKTDVITKITVATVA